MNGYDQSGSVRICRGLVLLICCLVYAARSDASEDEKLPKSSPVPISQESKACITCHEMYTPGIVRDWRASLHAQITPAQALKKPEIARRISVAALPDGLSGIAVGCFECHSRNPEAHKDNFRHNGYKINVVVSPEDCRICHEKEVAQYAGSKKAHASGNLMKNPVYHSMVQTVTGVQRLEQGKLVQSVSSPVSLTDTCLGCHGATIEVRGLKKIQGAAGEMMVPDLSPWPNQGVGRVNPDGSIGTCTACHSRHMFSIEMARKPATCGQCHLDPDVPAFNVYNASKHGNKYYSLGTKWNFTAVPWKLGEDFGAPTCAVCHNSLVVRPDGTIITERTHDFGARLWVRLFGLPYSHPQPVSGDTSIIRNADNQPLPLTLSGQPASTFLISPAEQAQRKAGMQRVCSGCHGASWVDGHFKRLDSTIAETDAMTLTASQLLFDAWLSGVADRTDPFDEELEKIWARQWLFYGNSIRYASAMTGAFDYASFKNGWWELAEKLQTMRERIDMLKRTRKPGENR